MCCGLYTANMMNKVLLSLAAATCDSTSHAGRQFQQMHQVQLGVGVRVSAGRFRQDPPEVRTATLRQSVPAIVIGGCLGQNVQQKWLVTCTVTPIRGRGMSKISACTDVAYHNRHIQLPPSTQQHPVHPGNLLLRAFCRSIVG